MSRSISFRNFGDAMNEESHKEIFDRLDAAREVMTDFKDWIRGEQRKRDDAAFKEFMVKIQTPVK